ncbi:TonB-dependent receptor [Pedobacter heparinus]|uniref:SusC/RagA family TonB-linked outer membrane protein n=1 Tax=Pedobacter heparinus TaxID=984 RepID=UPI00292E0B5B|nr:TonB-dependent receptor [Pedobacter heparinus]
MTRRILQKPKLLLTFLSSFLLFLSVKSVQGQSVSGTVRSSADNQPLSGVTVFVPGSKQVTTTNGEGRYQLIGVNLNASLSFSFIGYKTQTIPINGRNKVDVDLESTVSTLDEMVVVGYGTQKKENLTGAIATVTAKDLTAVPTPNVSTLLYGKLPGLSPNQRSGAPGDDNVALAIRGLGGALVVVDGIQNRNFTRLDPNEIESITVLKDAASAAIYGVSGGNGVILVTTKKGALGKPVFSYTSNFGVQHITKFPKPVDAEGYAILLNQSTVNIGGTPTYTQEEVQKFRDGTDPKYPNFNYYDYWMRDNAPQMQQNISVRGGSEKIKYFFLLGQSTQASIFRGGNQEYKKYNFRTNVSANITDNLEVSINLGARTENRDNMVQSPYLMAAWLYYQAPIYNPRLPDGKIASTNFGLSAYLDRDLTGYIKNDQNVFEGSLNIKYKVPFINGLGLNLLASRDMIFEDNKNWEKIFGLHTWNETTQTSTQISTRGVSRLIVLAGKQATMYVNPSLTYEHTFGENHNLKGMVAYEVSDRLSTSLSGTRQNYVTTIDQLFAGPDLAKDNTGTTSDAGRASYFGRFNYDYKGKYLLDYMFRFDGSAKFPPTKRWGFFQGISGAWRISEEKFFKNKIPAIDNLKLRGGWGKLGDDGSVNFQYLAGYTYPSGSYIYGGSVLTAGLTSNVIPNPNITWEDHQSFDLGFDMSMWKGLLTMEAGIFYKTSKGILATRVGAIPSTFGSGLAQENLNSLNSRGIEIALGHSSKIGEVSYMISTNVSYARLRNDHLEQRPFNNSYDNWRNNNEGREGSVHWGYKSLGQFESFEDIYASPVQDARANSTLRPGDIKYQDFNRDGVIDAGDIQPITRGYDTSSGPSAVFESNPLLNFGMGINLTWKRFTIDMNWAGAAWVYSKLSYNATSPFKDGRSANAYLLDNWHHADPTDPNSAWVPGKYPSTVVGGAANNLLISDFWVKNASYLRLKSAGITYNLQNNFLKKHGIGSFDLTLSGQNLLTFSGLGEIDPENRSASGSNYPQMMTFNAGARITF